MVMPTWESLLIYSPQIIYFFISVRISGGHQYQYVTNERPDAPVITEYDYDALMEQFQSVVGKLMQTNAETNRAKITHIVDKYLGKGKKVSDATIE